MVKIWWCLAFCLDSSGEWQRFPEGRSPSSTKLSDSIFFTNVCGMGGSAAPRNVDQGGCFPAAFVLVASSIKLILFKSRGGSVTKRWVEGETPGQGVY